MTVEVGKEGPCPVIVDVLSRRMSCLSVGARAGGDRPGAGSHIGAVVGHDADLDGSTHHRPVTDRRATVSAARSAIRDGPALMLGVKRSDRVRAD